MRKLFIAVLVFALVGNHYVYAETTQTTTVTCVDTVVPVVSENSPIEGDTTTTTTTTTNCTTTVVTVVTTPASTTTTTSVSENCLYNLRFCKPIVSFFLSSCDK